MAVILPIFLYTRVRSMAVLSYPDALRRSFPSANEAIRANSCLVYDMIASFDYASSVHSERNAVKSKNALDAPLRMRS